MMTYQIVHKIELETTECCACGVVFAIPNALIAALRKSGKDFYCPNGHTLSWSSHVKSENQRLRDKLDEQTKAASAMADRARAAEIAEQKAVKEIRRIKKRAAAGVCPCCNRTFQQLARHMKIKHPEAVKA